MKLSIILVNYNAQELTKNCIQSVYEKTKNISFEIILVDNNSIDGSCEIIKKQFSQVKIIINKQNKGFAYANNQAMQIATGKYILLLNNDTILKNNALDKMVAFMDSNPKVGALTCKLFDADEKTIQRNCRTFPTPFGTLFGRASLLTRLFPNNPLSAKNTLSDWNYDSIREVDWVSGAALMVRNEIINNVGVLDDKTYYMYWEDTDWCKRIRDAGWKIYFIPEAEIIHFCGKGGTKLKNLKHNLKMMFHMHYSAYKYFYKYYFKSPFHPMALLVMIGMVILIGGKSIVETIKYFRM